MNKKKLANFINTLKKSFFSDLTFILSNIWLKLIVTLIFYSCYLLSSTSTVNHHHYQQNHYHYHSVIHYHSHRLLDVNHFRSHFFSHFFFFTISFQFYLNLIHRTFLFFFFCSEFSFSVTHFFRLLLLLLFLFQTYSKIILVYFFSPLVFFSIHSQS